MVGGVVWGGVVGGEGFESEAPAMARERARQGAVESWSVCGGGGVTY